MGDVGAGLSASLTGAILAGGRASRLGGVAKGLLDVGGTRIVDRIAGALAPVVSELLIVTDSAEMAAALRRARAVEDVLTGGGSSAGVHAALRATNGPILAVACDLPFVNTALFRALVARAGNDVDAVVAVGPHAPDIEPLCAWYGPRCAGAIEAAWARGDRSLRGFIAAVRTRMLEPAEVAACGDVDRLFLNVNTPADLARARALAIGDADGDSATGTT